MPDLVGIVRDAGASLKDVQREERIVMLTKCLVTAPAHTSALFSRALKREIALRSPVAVAAIDAHLACLRQL